MPYFYETQLFAKQHFNEKLLHEIAIHGILIKIQLQMLFINKSIY